MASLSWKLVHTGNLWQETAVSSLDVKSSFPICITGCYGDVMHHCCDATQATGVFDNCRLFTTLVGLKTVRQQLHFSSLLFFSLLFSIWGLLICCFASDLCLHSSGWQSLISSHFMWSPVVSDELFKGDFITPEAFQAGLSDLGPHSGKPALSIIRAPCSLDRVWLLLAVLGHGRFEKPFETEYGLKSDL